MTSAADQPGTAPEGSAPAPPQTLAQDERLVSRLAQQGWRGSEWDDFADRAARYGQQCIYTWLVIGQLDRRLHQKGVRGIGEVDFPALRADDGACQELAADVSWTGLRRLRDRLREGTGWTPSGGASLRTYFIGQCLLSFVDVYRRWRPSSSLIRQPQRPAPRHAPVTVLMDDVDLEAAAARASPAEPDDPAEVSARRSGVDAVLARIADEQDRQVLHLLVMGYTHPEIAHILGLASARHVERRLHRIRRRFLPGGSR